MIDAAALRAVRSRDARFDGLFVYGVTTTRVFCRPSCSAPAAKREHVRILPTAAAALAAGFRSCKRCHPTDAPGAPEWRIRHAVARRAIALIADGAIDNGGGLDAIASALGYSGRQIRRHVVAEVGATPVALARARRAHAARTLLETTTLANVEIAYAAGFGSVRQLHETLRAVYDCTPSELRGRRSPGTGANGMLTLRLAYREPLAHAALLSDLAAEAADTSAIFDGTTYRRSVALPRGRATIALSAGEPGAITCDLAFEDLRDLPVAVSRIRRFLDLDADVGAITDALGSDPRLAPAVARAPGLRVLGAIEPVETLCALVANAPEIPERPGDVALLFDDARRQLAGVALAVAILDQPFATAQWRPRRLAVLRSVLERVAAGTLSLSPGADPDGADAALATVPDLPRSIAPEIRRRVFSDPDVPAADGGGIARSDAAWRPWRSYATAYLRRLPEPSTPSLRRLQ